MVPFVVGSTLMRNSRNFGALVARERSATNRAVRRAPGLKNKGERGRLRRRSFDRVEPMLDNDLFVKDFFSLFILLWFALHKEKRTVPAFYFRCSRLLGQTQRDRTSAHARQSQGKSGREKIENSFSHNPSGESP